MLTHLYKNVNQNLVVKFTEISVSILSNVLCIIQLLVSECAHELEQLTVSNLHCLVTVPVPISGRLGNNQSQALHLA
jgi:hypothetical protein